MTGVGIGGKSWFDLSVFSVSYKVRVVYGNWGNRAMCEGLRRAAKISDSWQGLWMIQMSRKA